MGCEVSREQLWSWIDRDAPELDSHLAQCEHCRSTAADIRRKIEAVAQGAGPQRPMPETIGPYVIRRFLGEGGQALVYEAEQPSLQRNVALKVLKGGRFASEKAVRRFQRESRALGHLQHPCIAAVYDAGHTEDGLHYFAMEQVQGTPLDAHVRRGNLDPDAKLSLFSTLCEAVQFAHQHGIVHRDLKPSNILVQRDGTPKILDFGLAKLLRGELALTITGTLVASGEGTPRYMSPEQASGKPEDIDERTDVYSLGVILYEMLTGETPYSVSGLSTLASRAKRREPVPPPSARIPGFPAALEAILLQALELDRADRYPSVQAFADDVARYRQARPIRARRPGWAVRARRWFIRHRARVAAAGVVLLLAGVMAEMHLARPSFDLESARFSLLEVRRDLFLRGDDPVVLARARDAAARYARIPEGRLIRAQGLVAAGQMNVAAVALRAYLEDDPSLWPAAAMLEEIEARRVGLPETDEVVSFPDTAEAWYLRSFASIDAQRALGFAQVALQRDAGDPLSLGTMAYLSEAAGQHEDALQWASRLIAVSGQQPRWLVYKSLLLFRLGRYEEALAEADRLVTVRPDDPNALNLRARVARRLRRYDLAVQDLTRCIELVGPHHPSAAWTYFHCGSAHWLNGQLEAAAEDYRNAYQLLAYPTYANARLFLVLNDLGRFNEARSVLAEARRNVWDDPWLALILDCLAGETSPQELIDSARGKKQLCEAYYYAAEMYRLRGQFPKAVDTYRACVDLGVESDPDQTANEPTDTMTEHELSVWRLARLAPD